MTLEEAKDEMLKFVKLKTTMMPVFATVIMEQAEPVKHGRWIEKENLVLCSKCGRPTEDRHDAVKEFNGKRVIARVYPYFCGYCGAKMDEEE